MDMVSEKGIKALEHVPFNIFLKYSTDIVSNVYNL